MEATLHRLIICVIISSTTGAHDLSTALENITSGKPISLKGNQYLNKTVFISNVSNISITGTGEVTVTCNKNAGFHFSNVDNLTIANLSISSCGISGTDHRVDMDSCFVSFNKTSFYAMIIINSREVTLENVKIANNSGFGLVAFNMISSLSGVTFSHNGLGGAYLIYSDCAHGPSKTLHQSHVNISNCNFVGNTAAEEDDLFSIYQDQLKLKLGGGLTVIFAQTTFQVEITVEGTLFASNTALYGSGVHFGVFYGVHNSSLLFRRCVFRENCIDCSSNLGSGLFAAFGISQEATTSYLQNVSLSVVDSFFFNNTAFDGAGIFALVLKVDSRWFMVIEGSVFEANAAARASAITTQCADAGGIRSKGFLFLQNCTVRENTCLSETLSESASAVNLQHISLSLRGPGTNFFLSNEGTALFCEACVVNVHDSTMFADNSGVYGGALRFSQSSLMKLYNNSQLFLHNNTAKLFGAAIYVHPEGEACFIQAVGNPKFDHCAFKLLNNTLVEFRGNEAPSSSMIFGSTLTCGWNEHINTKDYSSFYEYLYSTCGNRSFMTFDVEPTGPRQVSSFSTQIQVIPDAVLLFPGQQIHINITSLDIFNQPIHDVITVSIANEDGYTDHIVLDVEKNHAIMPLTVYSSENKNVEVQFLSRSSLSQTEIILQLDMCPLGWVYNSSSKSCNCEVEFNHLEVTCDPLQNTITVPRGKWIGEGKDDLEGVVMWGHCSTLHCVNSNHIITEQHFDIQCREEANRYGYLCGTCKANFSVLIGGSSNCLKCSNFSLFFIPLLLCLGILLIVALAFVHISVAEGYINSVLLYSNILSIYASYFVPREEWRVIFIITDILSIKWHFHSCLYDGMTELVAVMVQYAVIFYIFALMGIIYWAALRCILPGSHAYSPAKVGATLFTLCYISLVELSTRSLTFAEVQSLDGNVTLYLWSGDTELAYFRSLHALLGVLAILVIVLILLPSTLIIFFPRYVSKYFSSSFAAKLKSVLDAVWAPYKKQRRWWFGACLVLRWIIYICSITLAYPENIFALGLILLCVVFAQTKLRPYSNAWINFLDESILIFVLLLVFGSLYIDQESYSLVFTMTVLLFVYSAIFAVFSFHLYIRFPNLLSDLKKCRQWMKNRKKHLEVLEEEEPTTPIVTTTELTIAGLQEDANLTEVNLVTVSGSPVPDAMVMTGERDLADNSENADIKEEEIDRQTFHTCKDTSTADAKLYVTADIEPEKDEY